MTTSFPRTAAVALSSTAVLLLAACSSSSTADPSPWLSAGTTPQEQSSALMRHVVSNPNGPGCSAAVAQRGDVVWADAVGLANVASANPLTPQTAFDTASISKHITGMAVLTLVADGTIALDAPVATYLPNAGPWAASTTVEQLLHQTSGLADYIGLLFEGGVAIADPATQEDALATLRSIPAEETPAPYEYSNSNYLVLASIVEEVSGQSMADFAEERLFGPQGADLRFDPLATYPEIASRYPSVAPPATELTVGWDIVGDGGVIATPSALASWFDVFRTGLEAYPTIIDEMAAGAVEIPGANGSAYGAGIMVEEVGAFWHTGGFEGHTSYVGISEDGSFTVSIACNSMDGGMLLGTIAQGLIPLWSEE